MVAALVYIVSTVAVFAAVLLHQGSRLKKAFRKKKQNVLNFVHLNTYLSMHPPTLLLHYDQWEPIKKYLFIRINPFSTQKLLSI